MAPSLVRIAKPGENPPVIGTFHRGRGVAKKAGVWPGPGPRSDYDLNYDLLIANAGVYDDDMCF